MISQNYNNSVKVNQPYFLEDRNGFSEYREVINP